MLALLVVLGAIGALLGGEARGDTNDPREAPTIHVSVSPSSATTTDQVTITADITATSGYPDGTVKFATVADPIDAIDSQPAIQVEKVSDFESTAQVSTTFAQGTYEIVAYWTPSVASSFTLKSSDSTGDPKTLVVSDSTPTPTPTHITLTMTDLSGAPLSQVTQGEHVTLVAAVTADSGPTPTGGLVHFYDGSQELTHVTLVDGVATAEDVASFGPNQHELTASYDGNSPLWSGSQTDAANNAANTFTVEDTSPQPTTTQTMLSLSKPRIRVGDTVDLTAQVVQSGTQLAPVGGEVYFYSDADCQNGVLGPPVALEADGSATLRGVGNWAKAGDYTLCASYVGSTFNTDTPGVAKLSVLLPVSPTTLTLNGPSTAVYKATSTFTATLTDTNGPVVGKDVTIGFGSQSCTLKTGGDGTVTCAFAATDTPIDTVTANFIGDDVDPTASAHQGFSVTPAPTTLTVATNGPIELQGTLVEANGHAPIAGVVLHLSLGDQSCTTNATDSSGTASCTIGPVDAGSATLAGDSVADARYESDTFSELIEVPTTTPTTVTYTGPAFADYGDPVTFTAHVVAGSTDVAGPVTFTLGGQTCRTTAGTDGNATCTLTIDQKAGSSYTVATHYDGTSQYLPSDATAAAFEVTAEESTLALSAPATVTAGQTLHLSATLKGDGSTLSARKVDFTVGSSPACTAVPTDVNGIAACDVTATGSGTRAVGASFTSDGYYASATDSGSTLVQLTTSLAYQGAISADYGDSVALKAHFTTQDGNVPAGAMVTFTLGAQHCTTAVVAAPSDVTCTIDRLTDTTATTVEASYVPSPGSVYLASGDSTTFTVTPEETTLSLAAPAAAPTGSTVTVTAKLLEDHTTPADGSHPVVFTYGSDQTCTALTVGGIATCQIPATALGPMTIAASFDGDAEYALSSATASTLYVYAPTPGGGMFVVGDRSASGNVTFWGNQWWKQNVLSGGSAPSSFKGYALHASTTCGGSWSTDPGNSTPPPSGPLPSYIAVVVASSAAKSGATISGREVHVVVVKTSAGYDGNPGHAGTGAVVATIC